ncbi:flagellar assembly protein FliW [Halobacillus shinanisalinarum]|uniref:Flagellar assembly factor FliW n=1 Tax=Halobacillus shinanisalinarum TaxID=2932258 RepID=A0ABY4H496_9BACI|nr:flagellar assembly protein FliW [Halobacillus shinanisalinarum]UOQ94397.1 flagellar assembly protein FliW [Halobacillus shinanisalinarum]
MKIETKYFGIVEVEENEKIRFEQGLPGFEGYRSFVLLPVDETGVYYALQSCEEPSVSLIVVSPYLFYKAYEFELGEQMQLDLGIGKPDDVVVYSVVTLREPFKESTINLQAPIIVNVNNGKAKQLILVDEVYQTRHSLGHEEGGEQHARP